MANLSPALAEELDRPGAWEGVIVTDIRRGTPARRLRFRPGDLILAINGEAVTTVGALREALARQRGRELLTYRGTDGLPFGDRSELNADVGNRLHRR